MIEGYHAALANQAVGLDVLVFIQVSLATQSPDSAQAFGTLIRGLEEVQEAYSLTGEADYRTPSSEAEQFYQALKLRKVDTALVRVPNASHDISARPSLLIDKVAYILAWLKTHDVKSP